MSEVVLTALAISRVGGFGSRSGDIAGITVYPQRNKWYWILFQMSTCPVMWSIDSVTVTYRVRALASFIEPSTIACCGLTGPYPFFDGEHYCGPYGAGDTDWHVFSSILTADPRTGSAWTTSGVNSIYFGYGNWGGYYLEEDTSYLTDYLHVIVSGVGLYDYFTITTLPATEVWATGATIHGMIENTGGGAMYAYAGFQWGPNSNVSSEVIHWSYSGSYGHGKVPIQATISGLLPDRTYYYRACLHDGAPPMNVDNMFGDTLSFGGPVSVLGHGWEYVTAKKAEDDVSKLAVGRYYMDKSGNFVYESAKHRIK